MPGRVVIFSDTHLGGPGRGARSAEALRPLWKGARTLILNGDIAELSDPTWRVESAKHVLRIQELCEADGVELKLISGNHDPMLSDQRFLRLYDGKMFVTHGDVLHPAISPWNSNAQVLERLNAEAIASLLPSERMELGPILAAAQHASNIKWDDIASHHHPRESRLRKLIALPPKAARVLWFWLTMPGRAARFVARNSPEARFFVFGHYHRTGVWKSGGRIIINTGAFGGIMPPAAVVIENQKVKIHAVQPADEAFRLAPHPHRVFPLAG
ncbi:MAG: metallophosphoesterase family protein [Planctomycetota bacterium]|nr:metallophosphoesterase family protein [Planctomycetota bacterium]